MKAAVCGEALASWCRGDGCLVCDGCEGDCRASRIR